MSNKPILLLLSTAAAAAGCYRDDAASRAFAQFPGPYDPDDMDGASCIALCDEMTYMYAATTGGRFCFCSNELPATPAADDNKCRLACSKAGSGDYCGGDDRHVSIYSVTSDIRSVTVRPSDASDVTPVFVAREFDVAVLPRADGVIYRMDYDDGAGPTTLNVTGMFNNTYTIPGDYSVTVHASDLSQTLVSTERREYKWR